MDMQRGEVISSSRVARLGPKGRSLPSPGAAGVSIISSNNPMRDKCSSMTPFTLYPLPFLSIPMSTMRWTGHSELVPGYCSWVWGRWNPACVYSTEHKYATVADALPAVNRQPTLPPSADPFLYPLPFLSMSMMTMTMNQNIESWIQHTVPDVGHLRDTVLVRRRANKLSRAGFRILFSSLEKNGARRAGCHILFSSLPMRFDVCWVRASRPTNLRP